MSEHVRLQLLLQFLLALTVLSFNGLAVLGLADKQLESQRPALKRSFYANDRATLSSDLFQLYKTLDARVSARTPDRSLELSYGESKPVFSIPKRVAVRLTQRSSADMEVTAEINVLQLSWLSILLWIVFSVLASLGSIARARSLNKRRDMEATIQSSKAVVRTIQSLSHDLRRPFSQVMMMADLLERRFRSVQLDQETRKILQVGKGEVQDSVQAMNGLLSDIMHLNSPNPPLNVESMPALKFLEECLSLVFNLSSEKDIGINFKTQKNLQIGVDPEKYRRVILNILYNAVEAIDEEGELFVEIHAAGSDRARITLGNSGSYIEPNDLNKLFNDHFTKGKKSGTGLGLSIARKWVNAHGGEIFCHSNRSIEFPDGLVEFKFDCPLSGETDKIGPSIAFRKRSGEYQRALHSNNASQEANDNESAHMVPPKTKPRVALVEDSLVARIKWRIELADECELSEFSKPEEIFNPRRVSTSS